MTYRPNPQDGFSADELTAYEAELDGYGEDNDYVEIYCDKCELLCCRQNYKKCTNIKVNMNCLDLLGDPVCDGSFQFYLCDNCASNFLEQYHT